jgi:hypothetical protein
VFGSEGGQKQIIFGLEGFQAVPASPTGRGNIYDQNVFQI